MTERNYDWGTAKTEEDFRRRDPLYKQGQNMKKSNISTSNDYDEYPTSVDTQPVDNQYPGRFRFYHMPDDTIIDVMETPPGIGKWDQAVFYMYKRPIVPLSIVGVIGSFTAAISSLIMRQPAKTTHFWGNATAACKLSLIASVVTYAYYPPKFTPIQRPKEMYTELKD
jgi:hypothetical protein